MRTSSLFTVLMSFVWVGPALAAPGAKPKVEKLGPPTAEQFNAAEKNLKQIALAWHNYESVHGHFPNNSADNKGKPLLSWRVHILPYLEEDVLYRQFKLNEPWDSDNNKKLIDKMPKIYAPVRGKADSGMTFYQSFTGKHGLIKPGKNLGLAQIPDGTSNTFLAVEAAKPVNWTTPDDLVFDGKDVPALGGMFEGKFHFAFCDGWVGRFKKGVDADILRMLIDPADGRVIADLKDHFDMDTDK